MLPFAAVNEPPGCCCSALNVILAGCSQSLLRREDFEVICNSIRVTVSRWVRARSAKASFFCATLTPASDALRSNQATRTS